jgi:CubicO group peptidase (beta-lactamase class C family)
MGLLAIAFSTLFALAPAAQSAKPSVDPSVHLAPLDQLIEGMLAEGQATGASLAVARNGRLLYARGYGIADPASQAPVETDSIFRIASISKPITSLAILQLVDQGKLQLDDRIFEVLDLSKRYPDRKIVDDRWRKITLEQLLWHAGGFDRGKGFDPMFAHRLISFALKIKNPPSADQIIEYMLGIPLNFDPGTSYAYSNFGYCLLGRAIEAVSGMPYQDYVQQKVLAPLGIVGMKQGRTLLEQRWPNEVVYQSGPANKRSVFDSKSDKRVAPAYGSFYLEPMDSHGAWLASAKDLVRFASALGPQASRNPLSAPSQQSVFAPPAAPIARDALGKLKAVYYAMGWQVRPQSKGNSMNAWHSGSLPGTSTILVRRHDGYVWAVLFNGRDHKSGKNLASVIDAKMHQTVDQIAKWPLGVVF